MLYYFTFNSPELLCDWVNKKTDIDIVSITSCQHISGGVVQVIYYRYK